MQERSLFGDLVRKRPSAQLLKWVGNKFRHAEIIANTFPSYRGKYVEPFVGTGAVLATLAPERGLAGDILRPLIEIWKLLQEDPERLIEAYRERWNAYKIDRRRAYNQILEAYNNNPNGLDLLFLCRSCYGGIVRFTKEGKMSTPIGAHFPISPDSLAKRVYEWRKRVLNTTFVCADYKETMKQVEPGDLVYCDPPYYASQSILYGAQNFKLQELFEEIERCKKLGAYVALSIDGYKKSGLHRVEIDFPDGLFERELLLDAGASMLRRFQKRGKKMEGEFVGDRLLLTW